jgi:hypothetical protein
LYDIAFEVISHTDDGSDITGGMVRVAILQKLNRLTDDEIMEHIGFCDCYEIEKPKGLQFPHCINCGYEFSSCLGDDELPELCACGGKVDKETA